MANSRAAARVRSSGETLAPDAIDLALQNPLHYGGLGLPDLRRWLTELLVDLLSHSAGDPLLAPCSLPLAPAREGVSLSVRFVSDRQIRELNRRYREKDTPTDVLSFPGGGTPEGLHLGDLVIGVPTARRQAAGLRHSLGQEIRELVLHGVLHLLGHDHEVDGGIMDTLELDMRRRWMAENDD